MSTTVNSGGHITVGSNQMYGSLTDVIINSSGRVYVTPGGFLSKVVVNNSGRLEVGAATAYDITVNGGGIVYYNPRAWTWKATKAGGHIERISSGICLGDITDLGVSGDFCAQDAVMTNCSLDVSDHGIWLYNTTMLGGSIRAHVYLSSGCKISGTLIDGASLDVRDASIADVTVRNGGAVTIHSDGYASNTVVTDGATLKAGTRVVGTILRGGTQVITTISYYPGYGYGSASDTVVSSDGVNVISTGSGFNTVVYAGGTECVAGGVAVSTTVFTGGTQQLIVGAAALTTVSAGGTQQLRQTGQAIDTDVYGTQYQSGQLSYISNTHIHAGGLLDVKAGSAASVTLDGGASAILSWASIRNISAANGAVVELDEHSTISGGHIASGAILDTIGTLCDFDIYGNLTISSGTLKDLRLKSGTTLTTTSGGSSINCSSITVSSGAVFNISRGSYTGLYIAGGTVNNFGLNFHSWCVSDGVVNNFGGDESYTSIFDGGLMTVYSGSETGAKISGGTMVLREGAVLSNSYILSGGTVNAISGILNQVTVSRGAVLRAADLTAGGNVYMSSGSLLDFLVSERTPGGAAIIDDLGKLLGSTMFNITVNADQTQGVYALADGVSAFSAAITVVTDTGRELGTLSVGDGFTCAGRTYALDCTGDTLSLTVEGNSAAPAAVLSVAADITAPTNQNVTVTATFNGETVTKEYSLDNKTWRTYSGGVVMTANGTVYFRGVNEAGDVSEVASYAVSNIDKVVPVKPTAAADITAPTSGSVTVTASFGEDSVVKEYSFDKLIWSAYNNRGISMKENGTVYFRGIDEAGNVSEVESIAVRNIVADPGDALKFSGSVGFDGSYADSAEVKLAYSGWYTVAGDFGKLNGSVSIMQGKTTVASGTVKNGTLTFNKGKNVLLNSANDYTIVVKNSDKGKSASEYSFTLEAKTLFTKGDNTDDWTDMKTAGAAGAVGDLGVISGPGTAIASEWVGYGDAADYKAFTLTSAAKLSFTVSASDAAKFTVYALNAKTDKKGVTTYSLASKQSTALSKPKGATEYSATTKELLLEKGTYYIKVESTNASKGGDADYSVAVNAKSVFFTKGDNSDDDWQAAGLPVLNAWDSFSDWVGFGDAVDYRAVEVDGNGGAYNFRLSDVDADVKLTVYELNQKTCKLKSLKSVTATAKKSTVATGDLLLSGGEKYFVAVEAPGAKKAQGGKYELEMTESAVFDTGNNRWEDAEEIGYYDEVTGCVAKGADAVDFYRYDGNYTTGFFNLYMESGSVKVSFYDDKMRSVKAFTVTYQNGTLGMNVSSLTLTDGNAKTDSVMINAMSSAIHYLKIEAAGSGVNSYTLATIIS